jgi:hypothetical protein
MPEGSDLYDHDFFLWTQQQAAALRRAKDPNPEDFVSEEAGLAAKSATADLEQHGEHGDAVRARLDEGGFTAEQVLGDWFPEAADGVAHAAHG